MFRSTLRQPRQPRKPRAVRLFPTHRLISSIPILTIPRHPYVPISHLRYLLPSSVSRKSFVCYCYKICRVWGYPLVLPHPPHSTQGCSCWLASGSPLPTSVELLCYANHETTHEPRIRFTHRQNSRHPHLSPFHLGLYLCCHHLLDRQAIPARSPALDGHAALDRGSPDQPPLLCFGTLPRALAQRRGSALQDSRRFHHLVSLRRLGAHRARTFQGHSGIQHRYRRTAGQRLSCRRFLGLNAALPL